MRMIERMARAMAYEQGTNWDSIQVNGPGSGLQKMYIKLALVAIEAMREPTEGMRNAFNKDYSAWFNEEIEDPDHLYKTMIDAALSETPNENDS